MFVISQYLLNLSGTCKNINQISTYSIITGLVLYASIYLYLLFYNNEYLNIFNKFIIYIIIIDLLLSTFYYFNLQKSFKYSDDNSINIETYNKLKQDTNTQENQESDLESVDMSLIETDSELESDSDDEQEDLQDDLPQLQDDLPQLQDDLQDTRLQDTQQLQDTQLQDTQDISELQDTQDTQDTQENSSIKLNEIDELLSIPIPIKVKQKRGPRKKKNELQI